MKRIMISGTNSGCGKTSLVEALLYRTGVTDRLGKATEGTTVSDYDPEEIKRKASLNLSIVPIEYSDVKINLLDAPGLFDFALGQCEAMRAAGSVLIVLSGKSGLTVGARKAYKAAVKMRKPRAFFVSKMDSDHADFYKVLEQLKTEFGPSVCPLVVPYVVDHKVKCYVDLIGMKAYSYEGGHRAEVVMPDMGHRVEGLINAISEAVAETDEELMEKYFSGEQFTMLELIRGIHKGIYEGTITPVFCGSATNLEGLSLLMGAMVSMLPSAAEVANEEGLSGDDIVEVECDASAPTVAYVFKTIADQYGRFSFFKVMSGDLTPDMTLINSRTGASEKMGHIYIVKGKKNIEVDKIGCGDIGAVSKLTNTATGDTLCASGINIKLHGIDFAEPCYSRAIAPKVKGGEEKIASGLNKLRDEDPAFTLVNNAETKQLIISGAGDIHIDVLCSKLKNKFGVDVELSAPKVPYREKIRKKVSVEGKHKKQSGGHGQYGHVKMDFEPIYDGDEDFIFEETIFGGSVPKNFHPAVEKGIREAMAHGVLAGYPMVGLKATLTDGSYHDVDSNELSFKMAARLAYKAGIPLANPVILEPVCSLKVYVPDSYMGDVIGDLNKRRGRIMGMTPVEGGLQMIEAEAPMAEIADYAITLRSMTQGRGSFTSKFERYEEAPPAVQEKVIAESQEKDDSDE